MIVIDSMLAIFGLLKGSGVSDIGAKSHVGSRFWM